MSELTNPFPGIRNFEPEDCELFFGREKEINDILQILFEKHFVAVIGSSGCGKSSLIKAGLIPSLTGEKLHTNENWKKIYFRPGDLPMQSIAESIELAFNSPAFNLEKISTILHNDIDGLTSLIAEYDPNCSNKWLIYIDQFEEIFRYKRSEYDQILYKDSNQFVQLVIQSLFQAKIPIYFVLSIRSDFLGECSEFSGLIDVINKGNYLVPRMSMASMKQAIIEPVEKFGAKISSRLLDRLLEDAGESPDQLIVIQHAMMRTWDYWKANHMGDNILDIHHYEAIGTMKKALSFHGEQIYGELVDLRSKYIAEKVFKALVNVGSNSRGTRRPTSFKEICTIANATDLEVSETIDKFRRPENSFLMPILPARIEDDSVIDISHESIMLIWVRAKDWVKEESISEDLYLRLSKSAELYQLGNTGLWTNPDLDLALKWYQQNKPNKTWAFRYDPAYARAISFLDYSKSEFDKEIKHKENAQKRKLAFTRNFAIFLGAASIISILFLIIALNLRFKAEESEKKALEKEKLAIVESRKADEKSREAITHKKIAEQQQIIAEQQRIISEEQKKYAITQQEIAIVERNQADVAKNEAQVRRQQAEVSMNVAKKEKSKADSLRIIAFNEKEISERLRMLAIAKSLAIKSVDLFKTQRENTDIQKLLALHSFAINTKNKGSLYDPDIFTALSYASTQNKLFIGHKSKVRSLSFKDNENFISVSDDGIVKIWNKEKSVAEKSINTYSEPRSIAYASDKQILYVGCFDGKLLSVNLTNEKSPIIVLLKTGNSINAASYNNGFIAIGDSKGILTYWDSNLMLNDTNRINLNSKINSIVFSPDGEKFAVGCENGLIRIFFTNKYKVAYDLQKQGDAITALAFNSTNQELASTSVKNDIKIWNITTLFSTFVNIRHASRINAICFNPVDKLIASCSYDGTIKIVNYEKNDNDPVIIADQNDWVLDLKFSQDGAYLISAGNDKTVRLYGTNMSILAEKIKISRDFSASEWVKYAGLNVPFEPLNK